MPESSQSRRVEIVARTWMDEDYDDFVAWGDQLEFGRNRRAAIKAKMQAALQAQPTPVFPEESDDV